MTIQRQKQNNSALWLVLGGAFVLRMILAGVTEGYPYDMSCFVAWGEKLLADGPAGFYSGGYFADYPPARRRTRHPPQCRPPSPGGSEKSCWPCWR